MKVRTIFIVIFFLSYISVNAQRERNYIYLFDCTQSMINQTNIWEPTKNYLKEDIEDLAGNSSVSIVPFQTVVHPIMQFESKDFNWSKINSQFNEYIKDVTNTNICAAWDEGMKCQNPNKDNYLFILTDGNDNVKGMDALCARIEKWCGQNKNSFVFYVMLTDKARNQKLEKTINSCPSAFLIDVNAGHIPPFGAFDQEQIRVNTLDLKAKKISFSAAGEYEAVVSCKDPYFDVKLLGKIKDGKAIFKIIPKCSLVELNKQLQGAQSYSFNINVEGKGVKILNPTIIINVINKPERVLEMITEEANLGKASYYNSFLFWSEKEQDTLNVDLTAKYNKAAITDKSIVMFALSSTDSKNDYTILYNGKECPDKRFTIKPEDSKSILSIIFNKDSETGNRYFKITPITTSIENLERINDNETQAYEQTLRTHYTINYNPLAIILFWIMVLIVALLIIWFLFIKPSLYPTFKVGKIQIDEPYFRQIRIHGARKIIFTDKKKEGNKLSSIFKGKIVYEANHIWKDELAIIPSKKGGKAITQRKYVFTPFATSLVKHTDYTIENINTKEKAKIKIL